MPVVLCYYYYFAIVVVEFILFVPNAVVFPIIIYPLSVILSMNTRSGRPRRKPKPSLFSEDSKSLDSHLSLSPSSESTTFTLSAYESSTSTVISTGVSLGTDQEKLEPLPSTLPKAKPSSSATISKAKLLAQELKSSDVDPVYLLLSQLMENQLIATPPPQPVYTPANTPDSLAKSIGSLEHGEDIFVFLHRFEYGMKVNAVPIE